MKYLVFLFAILAVFCTAYGLKCYSCSNVNCTSKASVPCTGGDDKCFSAHIKMNNASRYEYDVFGCTSLSCSVLTSAANFNSTFNMTNCRSCTKDLCNGGNPGTSAATFGVIVIAAIAVTSLTA